MSEFPIRDRLPFSPRRRRQRVEQRRPANEAPPPSVPYSHYRNCRPGRSDWPDRRPIASNSPFWRSRYAACNSFLHHNQAHPTLRRRSWILDQSWHSDFDPLWLLECRGRTARMRKLVFAAHADPFLADVFSPVSDPVDHLRRIVQLHSGPGFDSVHGDWGEGYNNGSCHRILRLTTVMLESAPPPRTAPSC